MNPLEQKWEIDRVPIGSRGGSNTCWKIGPLPAYIYDDWRPRELGFSEDEVELAARAIQMVPGMADILERLCNAAISDMGMVVEDARTLLYYIHKAGQL